MRTLDVFRTSVAAAALGFARRALEEALAHARARQMFGRDARGFPADAGGACATWRPSIDAARLLTYRAAWLRDHGDAVSPRDAAMAKMTATESAQRVIDRAVQMFGGRGVMRGEVRRAAVSRDPRPAHLRGSERSAETDHRAASCSRTPREVQHEPRRFCSPPAWPRPRGYSNGIAASGRQVFIAGQIGWDAQCAFDSDELRRAGAPGARRTSCAVLAEAGGKPEHLVRLTWYVTSREEYLRELAEVGAAYREVMGKQLPGHERGAGGRPHGGAAPRWRSRPRP